MPTNPIGPGTINFPVNMPVEVRQVLGRLAFRQNRSSGSLARHLIEVGLEKVDPESAKLIAEIRRKRLIIKGTAAVSTAIIMVHLFAPGSRIERARPTLRARRPEIEMEVAA